MPPNWVGYQDRHGHSSTGSNHGTVSVGSEEAYSFIQDMLDDSYVGASSDIQPNVDAYKARRAERRAAKGKQPTSIPITQSQPQTTTTTSSSAQNATYAWIPETSTPPAMIAKKIPELRSTAKKYGRWEPRRAPEPQISSSFLAGAFPDFTGPVEPVVNNQSTSIELGRGTKPRQASAQIAPVPVTVPAQNPPVPAQKEDISRVMKQLTDMSTKLKKRREITKMQPRVDDGSEKSVITLGPVSHSFSLPPSMLTLT